MFYVQKGKIKLTVVSRTGKEATLGVLGEGSFFGEGGLAGQALRMGSASAMTDCTILRIDKPSMIQSLATRAFIIRLVRLASAGPQYPL